MEIGEVLLLGLGALAAVAWACVYLTSPRRKEKRARSRVRPPMLLAVPMWLFTIFACLGAVLNRVGQVSLNVSIWNVVSPVFALFFAGVTVMMWRRPGAPNKALVMMGFAYFVAQLVSLLINGQAGVGYDNQVFSLVYIPGTLVLIRAVDATREQLLRLALHISLAVVYLSVIVGALAPGVGYGTDYGDVRRLPIFGLTYRLAGITPHQNLLSVTAVIAIILCVYMRARLWPLSVAVCLLAIGMAESRNAAITVVVLAVFAWLIAGKSLGAKLVLSVPLAVLGWLYLPSLFASEDAGILTADASNFNTRSEIWDSVIYHWDDRFLFGWGPLAFQERAATPFPSLRFLNAHNQLLQAIAEAGLIGLIAMAGFIVAMIAIAWRHRTEVIYPCLVLALVISMATEVFFTVHLYGLSYAAVPAMLSLAILMSADARTDGHENESESVDGGAVDVLPVRTV